MERRDYLEDQIKQLAQVLANMIGFITGKKSVNFESASEAVSQALQGSLDVDLSGLIDLPDPEFIERLVKTTKFDSENLETLADVFYTLAESTDGKNDDEKVLKLYAKALSLYKYIEQNDKNYSLLRNNKIVKIEQQLK